MFSGARLKIHLKLCINRLKLVRAKKENLSLHSRKDISNLLINGKIDSAKIRIEGIIRDDDYCEALEILELFCELLLARFGLIELPGPLDETLVEAAQSLIYSAARCGEVKELAQIRDQFLQKCGKEFIMSAINDSQGLVSQNIVKKLGVTPPSEELVDLYLTEIAKRYNVPGYGDDGSSEINQPEEIEDLLIDVDQENIVDNDLKLPSPPKEDKKQANEKEKQDNTAKKELEAKTNTVKINDEIQKVENNSKAGVPTLSELEARFAKLKRG